MTVHRLSLVVMPWLPVAVASLVAEHRLQARASLVVARGLSNCGT